MRLNKKLFIFFAALIVVFSSASLAYANEPLSYSVPKIRQIVKSPCTLKPKDEDIGFEVRQIAGPRDLDFDESPNAKIDASYNHNDNLLVTEGNMPDGYFESIMEEAGAGEYIFEISERRHGNDEWAYDSDKRCCFLRSVKNDEGKLRFCLTESLGDNGGKLERHDFKSCYRCNRQFEYVTIQNSWASYSAYFDRDLKFKIKVSFVEPGNTEEKIMDVESSVNEPATIELPIGTRLTVWEERCPDGYNYGGGSAYNYNREIVEYKAETVGYVFPEPKYNTITIKNKYKEVSLTGLAIDNLPFIVMIGVPIIVGAGWVVRKRFA